MTWPPTSYNYISPSAYLSAKAHHTRPRPSYTSHPTLLSLAHPTRRYDAMAAYDDNNTHSRTPSFASMVFDLDSDDQPKPQQQPQHIFHSPTTASNYDTPFPAIIKSEPDLTIPLGWEGLSTSPSQGSNLSHSESPGPKYLQPPSASTSGFDSPEFQQQQYVDWNDATQNPYAENMFVNPAGGIPWSQWTEFDYEHGLDMDMPQTPIDPLPASFDVYTHNNGSDAGFFDTPPHIPPQSCPDLFPNFTSMQLESPPQTHRSPPTATYNAPPSDDSERHQQRPTAPLYKTAHDMGVSSPMGVARPIPMPMPVISPTRHNNTDLSFDYHHLRHHLHHGHNPNLIPTLSSSLPASLAISSPPQRHIGFADRESRERVSSLDSSPANGTRGRSRAKSDASAPQTPLSTSPPKTHSPRHGLRRRKVDELPSNSALDASPLKPPKQSLSTWQIFFTDWIARQDANGGRKLNVAQAAKEAGKEYKLLSKREKEPYERRAAEARAGRQAALSNWHSTLTPSLIALENRYRTTQRKLGLSRKSNLKDPNAPKKPLSAYFMFLKAVREDDTWAERVFEGEKETTRQSVMAAAKWREMSDDEKRPFLARAEQEKLEYEAARKEYEDSFAASGTSRDSSSSPTGGGSYSRHHHRVRSNSTGSTAMAFRLDDISGPPLASSAPTTRGGTGSAMGYFSADSSSSLAGPIPIHIPKRSRADSSPSPTSPYSAYL